MRLWATKDATNGKAIWRQKPDWSASNRFFHCGESKVPMLAAEKWGGKWAVDVLWPAGLMLDPGEIVEIDVTSAVHREESEERHPAKVAAFHAELKDFLYNVIGELSAYEHHRGLDFAIAGELSNRAQKLLEQLEGGAK